MKKTFKTIVLTGGPSGGKTTCLAILRQKLEEMGYVVVISSECATDIMSDGITPSLLGNQEFQRQLMTTILERERGRERALAAAPGEKKVLILDRTTHDAAAYMEDAAYSELVESLGYSKTQMRDRDHDGVIFLRSPATDKPEVYTTATNAMRRESVEEAKALDERSLGIWVGTPHHLSIIDNKTDMQGKALRVLQAACHLLGEPEPIEIERKFLVHSFSADDLPAHTQKIDIVQHYLQMDSPGEGESERVRARGQHGDVRYYHAIKRARSALERIELEEEVSEERYRQLLKRAHSMYHPIEKTRHCFVYNNQYCELDAFKHNDLVLLEIELTTVHDEVTLPPFLDIVREVTEDTTYSNKTISYKLARDRTR